MLGLKLNHVSKRGHCWQRDVKKITRLTIVIYIFSLYISGSLTGAIVCPRSPAGCGVYVCVGFGNGVCGSMSVSNRFRRCLARTVSRSPGYALAEVSAIWKLLFEAKHTSCNTLPDGIMSEGLCARSTHQFLIVPHTAAGSFFTS